MQLRCDWLRVAQLKSRVTSFHASTWASFAQGVLACIAKAFIAEATIVCVCFRH